MDQSLPPSPSSTEGQTPSAQPHQTKLFTTMVIALCLVVIPIGALILVSNALVPRAVKTVIVSQLKTKEKVCSNPLEFRDPPNSGISNTYSLSVEKNCLTIKYNQSTKKYFATYNGKKTQEYPEINRLTTLAALSPDGKHFAFVVRDGDRSFVVTDFKENKKYNGINNLTFSPDSSHLAYSAGDDRGKFVVRDDQEGKLYEEISDLQFSPDSSHLGYKAAILRGGYRYIVDDQEGPELDDFFRKTKFTFSADGKNYAYQGKKGDQSVIVLNHQIVAKAPVGFEAGDFALSSDGKHFAYAFNNNDMSNKVALATIDGKQITQYYHVAGFLYSPDSSRLAYKAATSVPKRPSMDYDLNYTLILDGKEVTDYPMRSSPWMNFDYVFSPDSRHFAYVGMHNKNNREIDMEQWVVVVDGKTGPVLDILHKVLFTPDSRHTIIMTGNRDSANGLILDGKKILSAEYILGNTVYFSPDNQLIICNVKDGNDSYYLELKLR